MADHLPNKSNSEFPAGAIENGRTFIHRIETDYDFQCDAGGISNCYEWIELVRCFEYMASYLVSHRRGRPPTGFDKKAYDREYMRKKRAREKAKSTPPQPIKGDEK